MRTAKIGDTVQVRCLAKLEDGTVVLSTKGGGPLKFQIGAKEVLKGIESSIVGMKVGELKVAQIAPEESFGAYSQDLILKFDRSFFPPKTHEGDQLELILPNHSVGMVKVLQVKSSEVIVDANHPWSGHKIDVKLKLVKILESD